MVYKDKFYMNACFQRYAAVTKLNLDDPIVRRDKNVLTYLNGLGIAWSADDIETEWNRIKFITENSFGQVLEIGCATGTVTKNICKNNSVSNIISLDIEPAYIDYLKSLGLDKVSASVCNLITDRLDIVGNIDCVVMTELIEHITTKDEIKILNHIKSHLGNRSIFIVTTPRGFMPDLDHIRGFSPISCYLHLSLFYGRIIKITNIGPYQCFIVGASGRNIFRNVYIRLSRKFGTSMYM